MFIYSRRRDIRRHRRRRRFSGPRTIQIDLWNRENVVEV